MSDLEHGFKWWMRYVIVPVIVAVIAILAVYFGRSSKLVGDRTPSTSTATPAKAQAPDPHEAAGHPAPIIPPAQHNAVNTPVKSSTKIKGNKNVAGNAVSGNNNVVGNNNQTAQAPVTVGPGSIVNSGNGTLNNPTVINNGPLPFPKPTVQYCILGPFPQEDQLVTVITMTTSEKIAQPGYTFLFDGPVVHGQAVVYQHTGVLNEGRLLDPAQAQNSYGFKMPGIDMTPNWVPGQQIRVDIYSRQPLKLVRIWAFSEDKPYDEFLELHCDPSSND